MLKKKKKACLRTEAPIKKLTFQPNHQFKSTFFVFFFSSLRTYFDILPNNYVFFPTELTKLTDGFHLQNFNPRMEKVSNLQVDCFYCLLNKCVEHLAICPSCADWVFFLFQTLIASWAKYKTKSALLLLCTVNIPP